MTYVLIYWLFNGQGMSTHTQEFNSQATCEAAGRKIDGTQVSWGGVTYGKYYCVTK